MWLGVKLSVGLGGWGGPSVKGIVLRKSGNPEGERGRRGMDEVC